MCGGVGEEDGGVDGARGGEEREECGWVLRGKRVKMEKRFRF